MIRKIRSTSATSSKTPYSAALIVCVEGIPEALCHERRWVCWRYVLRDGRWTKMLYQTNGIVAKSNDASTWTMFSAAMS